MNETGLKTALSTCQQRSNAALSNWIDTLGHSNTTLIQAMKYGTLFGGKRIRPFLTYTTGEILGVPAEFLDTPAAAVECIHAYSLIHDDLPAMDNDDLRRGQPTCHIQFDEANAILAGDALQTLAFSILAQGVLAPQAEQNRIQMVQELAQAAGARGMCLGQSLDLCSEGQTIDLEKLEIIHQNKTGALIQCAVRLGVLASGEKGLPHQPAFDRFAHAIGLAFQVQDDILDIISDTETLGKPQGSDLEAVKSTYPALLGLEGAQQKAALLYEEALFALKTIPYNTEKLEQFARYVIERNY